MKKKTKKRKKVGLKELQSELKPCPFCGGKLIINNYEYELSYPISWACFRVELRCAKCETNFGFVFPNNKMTYDNIKHTLNSRFFYKM